MQGVVEAVTGASIRGWTIDSAAVQVKMDDGTIIGQSTAHVPRPDLSGQSCSGFLIETDMPVTPSQLATGQVKVWVTSADREFSLPLWEPLRNTAIFEQIDLLSLRTGWSSLSQPTREAATTLLTPLVGGRHFGRIAADETVQVGRNGHLFLAGGQNHLADLYAKKNAVDVNGWMECFRKRSYQLAALEIPYLQVLIPEKTSVLFEYAPYPASAGSAAYRELVSLATQHFITLLDLLPVLASESRSSNFPTNDSHLSCQGAECVFRALLKSIGTVPEYERSESVLNLQTGDLGLRFTTDGDIQEFVEQYSEVRVNELALNPSLQIALDPPSGHLGTHRVWKNEFAPIRKRVVCFGNSFFERGITSNTLSWWFARFFSEFHFIWSPDLDMEYVAEIRPDVVLCQTIERFLTKVPAS